MSLGKPKASDGRLIEAQHAAESQSLRWKRETLHWRHKSAAQVNSTHVRYSLYRQLREVIKSKHCYHKPGMIRRFNRGSSGLCCAEESPDNVVPNVFTCTRVTRTGAFSQPPDTRAGVYYVLLLLHRTLSNTLGASFLITILMCSAKAAEAATSPDVNLPPVSVL